MPARGKESYTIHSVDNALNVLETLCEEEEEISLSALSERLRMNKASVFRLLATFEGRGYVERDATNGRYRLGIGAFDVGQRLLSRMTLLRHARPVMEQLARECNETIYLVVRRDDRVLFFDMVDTSHQVKIVPLVGEKFPLKSSVPGRLFLAYQDDAQELQAAERESIRRAGLCLGNAGVDDGVMCAAAPIFFASGVVAGALAMLWPDFRVDDRRAREELCSALVRGGGVVSSKLGYLGHYLGKELVGRAF